MSTQLERWGIEVMSGYRPENLDRARPDLVVVGNVVRAVNPEAAAMRERGLPHVSFPQALGERFIAPRHGVVVAGTHGKTTTSAMMGALLHHAGRDPSFLVGGVTRDFDSNFRLGAGPHFVVEGDEYDTAYFDKGPKFLHYRPRTAIFTSCELDHADIYRDEAHYESAFERFVDLLPADGFLAACARYESVRRICAALALPAWRRTGSRATAPTGRRATSRSRPRGRASALVRRGERLADVLLPVGGAHNVENALGVAAAATALGLSPAGDRRWARGVPRREASPGGAGHGRGRDGDRRLRPPPTGGEGDAGRHPGPLPAGADPGGVRAAVEHQPAEPAPGHYAARETWGPAAQAFVLRPAPAASVPEAERLDVDAVVAGLSDAGLPAQAFTDVERWSQRSPRLRGRATSSSRCPTGPSAGSGGSCSTRSGQRDASDGTARQRAPPVITRWRSA